MIFDDYVLTLLDLLCLSIVLLIKMETFLNFNFSSAQSKKGTSLHFTARWKSFRGIKNMFSSSGSLQLTWVKLNHVHLWTLKAWAKKKKHGGLFLFFLRKTK